MFSTAATFETNRIVRCMHQFYYAGAIAWQRSNRIIRKLELVQAGQYVGANKAKQNCAVCHKIVKLSRIY